jgi:hypothetical protein
VTPFWRLKSDLGPFGSIYITVGNQFGLDAAVFLERIKHTSLKPVLLIGHYSSTIRLRNARLIYRLLQSSSDLALHGATEKYFRRLVDFFIQPISLSNGWLPG